MSGLFLKKPVEKAVAITYDNKLPAPFVIAKGKAKTAEKICKIAEEYGIEVVNDEKLLDNLYFLDIGEMIPEDLYIIMAEILAFVYSHEEAHI